MEVILTNEVKPGIWDAKGFFEASNGEKGDVDLLVKKVEENKVQLFLDSSIKPSRIMGREVLSYTNAKPEDVQPAIQAGAKVKVVHKIWFNLKKNDKP